MASVVILYTAVHVFIEYLTTDDTFKGLKYCLFAFIDFVIYGSSSSTKLSVFAVFTHTSITFDKNSDSLLLFICLTVKKIPKPVYYATCFSFHFPYLVSLLLFSHRKPCPPLLAHFWNGFSQLLFIAFIHSELYRMN